VSSNKFESKRRTIPNLYSTDHLLQKQSTVDHFKNQREITKKEQNLFSDKNLGRAGFQTNYYNKTEALVPVKK